MCLQIITNKEKQETDWMPAWKVMTKGRMQIPEELPYENPYDVQGEYRASYKFDTIYQTTLGRIFINAIDNYPAGFHCFTNKEDADFYQNVLSMLPTKTTPVLIKNVLCEGVQIYETHKDYELKVIVTEFIQIPRPTND